MRKETIKVEGISSRLLRSFRNDFKYHLLDNGLLGLPLVVKPTHEVVLGRDHHHSSTEIIENLCVHVVKILISVRVTVKLPYYIRIQVFLHFPHREYL